MNRIGSLRQKQGKTSIIQGVGSGLEFCALGFRARLTILQEIDEGLDAWDYDEFV